MTGPTGTNGGAKEGTGPEPMTFINWHPLRQVACRPPISVANPWTAILASLSLDGTPNRDKTFLAKRGGVIAFVPAEGIDERGNGTFGMGGACAPGKAVNAGYMGRPGMITFFAQRFHVSLKAWSQPSATDLDAPAAFNAFDILP